MQVKELRLALEALQTMLSSWECKAKNLTDLGCITGLLAEYDELSVKEFSRRIEDALRREGGDARIAAKPPQVNEAKVTEYMDRLSAPGLDRLGYMSILSELRADKKARNLELSAIANRLTHADNK